ncbi:hypothetical protein [Paracoccus salsus]|uniref:hypothetical protein n=1 Tax=Paracoccus salsus TaxID=2911061 RepID=UPI001F31B333|nr:hypothetical protein [Paracoccus salsus]MCF3973015.1 hypothetical protein [Paracoccus salsus]
MNLNVMEDTLMKAFVLAAVLAVASPGLALAQMQPSDPAATGLSQPVIALTGVLAKNTDTLALNDEQKAALASWLAEMPAMRKSLEDEAVALRTEIRAKIAAGAPAEERESLARQIGEKETALIMMRSECVDHWREVLSADQFARLLQLAAVTE